MNLVRFAVLSFLVAPACDSPGGGGGGVNCAVTPNLPICQQLEVGGDTSPGDVTTLDATPPMDTVPVETQLDTQPPQDTQVDTQVPQDTQPPQCPENQQRCNGTSVELCTSGTWLTVDSCEVCQNGACVVQPQDCTAGQRQCNGSSVETCSGGAWVLSQSCPSGCSNGVCNNTSTGSADCNGVLDCAEADGCFATAPDYDQACWNGCLAEASTTGRNEASAMISCYDNCGWDGVCAYDVCSPQRAACFFDRTGGGNCAALDECIYNCVDDACAEACYGQSTAAAQAAYLWLVGCVNLYCEPGDQDCVGQVLSAGGPCEGAYLGCIE